MSGRPDSVYFFGTCVIDNFFPRAGMAGIQLLEREGIQVIYPQSQSCCGQPAYNSGFEAEAREVARAQIALFPKDIPVIIPSGSCAGMMVKHYPELFRDDPLLPQVEAFCARVYELTQFLVTVMGVKLEDKGEPVKVTWHNNCHTLREMGVHSEPKSLLKQLKNVELVELKRERECCGFGGTFSVKYPDISGAMVQDKTADVCGTGASRVLSTDCGCLMNIGGALEKQGKDVEPQHIAEFLWERTND